MRIRPQDRQDVIFRDAQGNITKIPWAICNGYFPPISVRRVAAKFIEEDTPLGGVRIIQALADR